jgi:hypothetical protein
MEQVKTRTLNDGVKAEYVGGRRVIAVTEDGVRILRPRKRATHFTDKQAQTAVAYAKQKRIGG